MVTKNEYTVTFNDDEVINLLTVARSQARFYNEQAGKHTRNRMPRFAEEARRLARSFKMIEEKLMRELYS